MLDTHSTPPLPPDGGGASGRRRTLLSTRAALILAVLVTLVALSVPAGASATTASWQFAPAAAPDAPAGVPPAPYAVPLGEVGQISFWSPNRGLIITGGTETEGGVVPSGIYAYNGVSWHELANVCGGAEGRIAWAGPDEFWTISDQRAGQDTGATESPLALQSISLCHFLDGQVVGSYAMPLGQADSYMQMDAAACLSASDCWFGGDDTNSSTPGAFQLHWDGSTVTATQESEDHAVADMTLFGSQLYESVGITAADVLLPSESTTHTAVLHSIATGQAAFSDVYSFGGGQVLPAEGTGVLPDALGPLALSTDAPAGAAAGASALWGVANPTRTTPTGSKPAALTVLERTASGWSQILPALSGSGNSGSCPSLPAGTVVGNGANDGSTAGEIAALPGASSAWLAVGENGDEQAQVALLSSSGCVTETDALGASTTDTSSTEPTDVGDAGPMVCPAANDCWLATYTGVSSSSGWLFHYTDGTQYQQDTDSNFAGVISYRPSDDATPSTYSTTTPDDDSLANQQTVTLYTPTTPARTKKGKPVAYELKAKLKRGTTTMVFSFRLRNRARVQLLAYRGRRLVARTPQRLLASGHHRLTLKLNVKRWPNRLKLNAHAVTRKKAALRWPSPAIRGLRR